MYPTSGGNNKNKASSTNTNGPSQSSHQQQNLTDTFNNLFQLNQFNLFNSNTNNLFFPTFTPPNPNVPPRSTHSATETPKPKKTKENGKAQTAQAVNASNMSSSLLNMNHLDLYNFYQNQINTNLSDFLLNPALLGAAAAINSTNAQSTSKHQTTPYSIKDLIEPKQQNPSQSQNPLNDLNLWTTMLQTAAASLFTPQSTQPQELQPDLFHLNQLYLNQIMSNSNASQPSPKSKKPMQQANDTGSANNTNEEMRKIDENKIKFPLKLKWRRETIVKEIHKNGIRGDVIYYSPCGKKLRTFQEIERYLLKHGIKNLSRDNFTFSSKYIVGLFLLPVTGQRNQSLEQASSQQANSYKISNEEQIIMKVRELNPNFNRKSTALNEKKLKTSPTDDENNVKIQADLKEQKHMLQQKNQQQLLCEQQQNEILKRQQAIAAANLQQEQKRLINERKLEEKQEQTERKIKEKWFEAIVMREFKKQIDDMQEKFLTDLPKFQEVAKSSKVPEHKIQDDKTIEKTDDDTETHQADIKSKFAHSQLNVERPKHLPISCLLLYYEHLSYNSKF
jgi:hypothetical protein